MSFDKGLINKTISEFWSKAIDDTKYPEIVLKIPEKDNWRILKKSKIKFEKLTIQEIITYEKRYRVIVPEILKYLLTEIGQSIVLWHWFFDNKDEGIWEPILYMSEQFFIECAKIGISQDKIDRFSDYYSIDTNSFSDEEIQSVFVKLDSDDDLCISKLLYTGHGSCAGGDYILINKIDNGKVVYDGDWATKQHLINGKEYFHYSFGWLNEYFLRELNNKISTTYTVNNIKKIYK